jgi:hypothetical protein
VNGSDPEAAWNTCGDLTSAFDFGMVRADISFDGKCRLILGTLLDHDVSTPGPLYYQIVNTDGSLSTPQQIPLSISYYGSGSRSLIGRVCCTCTELAFLYLSDDLTGMSLARASLTDAAPAWASETVVVADAGNQIANFVLLQDTNGAIYEKGDIHPATRASGTWTAPSTFSPAVPLVYVGPAGEAPSFYSELTVSVSSPAGGLSDGSGRLFTTQSPLDCPVSGTLELTKLVSGGPAVPGNFTLSAVGGTDTLTGAGHVGPSEVAADTYELSEIILSGATWDADSGTWSSDDSTWDGDYIPSAWDCGDATMPTPTSVVVPPGGTVACRITNTFEGPAPPPPPPLAGSDAVGCFELLRVDVTLMPARHLPTRGSTK